MKDTLDTKGELRLKVIQNGQVVSETIDRNLIVNVGRQSLAQLLGAATAGKRVTTIGLGTASTPAQVMQTSIENPFTKTLDGASYVGTSVNFAFTITEAENNNVVVREFALFSQDGTMFSRLVRNPINKTSDIRLEGVWSITF